MPHLRQRLVGGVSLFSFRHSVEHVVVSHYDLKSVFPHILLCLLVLLTSTLSHSESTPYVLKLQIFKS